MRELDSHAGFFHARQYLCLFPCLLFVTSHIPFERFGTGVPGHVEQAETQLAEAGISHIEVGSVHDALNHFFRNVLSRLVMLGKCIQKILFNGKVFHDLRRKFHKIPIYIGSAHALVGSIGKHTVQRMTEFMQEGVHFGEGEQCRFVFRRLGKVHGYGHMRTAVAILVLPLFLVTGHPGTRTLAGTRMEIGIEYCQETAVLVVYFIRLHIRMIDRNVRVFLKGDAIQTGSQSEYPLNHVLQFEVRTQFLFVQVEFLFFQFFGIVGPVPRHQFEVFPFQFPGQLLYFFHFLMSGRRISLQQFVQQFVHILTVFCHSSAQYIVGYGIET